MSNETNTANICNELVRYSGTVHSGASHAMRTAERALLSQERQIKALKADAERYRWIKSRDVANPTDGPDVSLWVDSYATGLRGDEADKAIDAAMNTGA